jgi:NADH-quinone oxidoreductase subunit A
VTEYIIIGIFALVGLLFAGGALLVSRLLAPRFPDRGKKLEPYESGEDTIGSARMPFKLGYYLFALVFLVFDVEAVFLFPAISVMRSAGSGSGEAAHIPAILAWGEVAVFLGLLGFGLLYAWRKKVLEWE